MKQGAWLDTKSSGIPSREKITDKICFIVEVFLWEKVTISYPEKESTKININPIDI